MESRPVAVLGLRIRSNWLNWVGRCTTACLITNAYVMRSRPFKKSTWGFWERLKRLGHLSVLLFLVDVLMAFGDFVVSLVLLRPNRESLLQIFGVTPDVIQSTPEFGGGFYPLWYTFFSSRPTHQIPCTNLRKNKFLGAFSNRWQVWHA
jgi:hypothetical protein